MNQTKKRLAIIKLSISITDEDCIQHQILKLSQIKSDEKLENIIELLQSKNYAQAQALITTYIETPMQEILQRSTRSKEEELKEQKKNMLVNDFDLLPKAQKIKKIDKIEDIDAFINQDPSSVKSYEEDINYDSLLNLEAEDILTDNINIDISAEEHDDFFHPDHRGTMPFLQSEEEQDKGMFDQEVLEKERAPSFDDALSRLLQKEKDLKETDNQTEKRSKQYYKPIPYIEQKFKDIAKQYPPVASNETITERMKNFLDKIQNIGYTENEIEEMISAVFNDIHKDDPAEAANLLLIAAATSSPYAQFMLARALFKGHLLQKNVPEAFAIIYKLANNERYAEAICDLAQLYEYGIGTERDIQKAESLYEEAYSLGIQRAKKHITQLRKENRGLFSRFKK